LHQKNTALSLLEDLYVKEKEKEGYPVFPTFGYCILMLLMMAKNST
jgi:hypothetical protein